MRAVNEARVRAQGCVPDADNNRYWTRTFLLSDAKSRRKSLISTYQSKINTIKATKAAKEKEEAKRRFKEYWEDHSEEKASLEAESQSLSLQIATLNTEASNVSGRVEKANLEERIQKLEVDKKALSMFRGKEKKVLQDQIDVVNAELSQISVRMNAAVEAINKKNKPLTKRKNEIQTELTKNR